MKSVPVKSNEERAILVALIVNDGVLAAVHGRMAGEKRPFENKWSNLIAHWCFAYFGRYHKAPRKHITNLYHKHADKIKDPDVAEVIEAFLSRLSKDHEAVAEEMNEKYLIDLSSAYFERVRLTRTAEGMQQALDNEDAEEAKSYLTDFKSVSFSSSDWSDPFSKESIRKTFHYYDQDRTLIQFPGALDEFLSPHFERDGFIAFAAPEKRGKSFWLLETVYQGIRQRKKVLYYVLGDMSEDQAFRRLYMRATRRPFKTKIIRFPRRLLVRDGEGRVKFRNKRRIGLSRKDVAAVAEKLRQATASKELPVKVRCVGASVISASDIERDVAEFARDGWVADVVVVDYIDLLAPEASTKSMEYRHQVNESWKIMRRVSLDNHCLVVTATQAAATAYDSRMIRKKDFSEDKRKNAHVTGMCGINQTSDEKKMGIYRLNWVFLRDGEWADTDNVWTAGNLGIACPCLLSTF